jgi:hypothetical protein
MKRAFLLPVLLALPLVAHAGDPGEAVLPADPILLTGEKVQPLSLTVIPLSEVRVVSLKEFARNGGISPTSPKETGTRASKKPKKKKRLPRVSPSVFAMAAMGATYEAPRTWGDTPALASGERKPVSPSTTVTRAAGAAAPEPGSAALVLLALPALGYFRVRSRNA